MTTLQGGATGPLLRGPTPDDVNFGLQVVTRETVVESASQERTTDRDAIVDIHTSATVLREADVIIRNASSANVFSLLAWYVQDEGILTIDADGRCSWVANGTTGVTAHTKWLSLATRVSVERVEGVAATSFVDWEEGSAAKWSADQLRAAVAGLNPDVAKPLLTDLILNTAGTWNPQNWLLRAGVRMDCMSLNRPNGTLVAPDLVITAEHYDRNNFLFRSLVTGDYYYRPSLGKVGIGPPNSQDWFDTDVVVHRIEPIPAAAIKPCLVAPDDIEDYFPSIGSYWLPGFGGDQEKKGLVGLLQSLGGIAWWAIPTDPELKAFYEQAIGGDSGGKRALWPLPGDDRPVVTNLLTYGGPGGGPELGDLSGLLDDAATELESNYGFSYADYGAHFENYA